MFMRPYTYALYALFARFERVKRYLCVLCHYCICFYFYRAAVNMYNLNTVLDNTLNFILYFVFYNNQIILIHC